jgi:hypothetical protein
MKPFFNNADAFNLWAIASEETKRLPTCGPSAVAFGASANRLSAVGTMEIELRGCAKELQKQFSGGFRAEHFGH